MPRRHHRARETGRPIDDEAVRRGVQSVEVARDGDWLVRAVMGDTGKVYRCPGCDQETPTGVPHVVVWPADERGDLSDRRHWHTGCWRARGRRTPVTQRSRSAPRYG
jgi:hypothetical protein